MGHTVDTNYEVISWLQPLSGTNNIVSSQTAAAGHVGAVLLWPTWLACKEKQRPDRHDAASHVGAAVLAHVARSGRSDAAFRWKEL